MQGLRLLPLLATAAFLSAVAFLSSPSETSPPPRTVPPVALTPVALATPITPPAAPSTTLGGIRKREPSWDGFVTIVNRVQVPARQAGVLARVEVRVADAVLADQRLAALDASLEQVQRRIAVNALHQARQRVEDQSLRARQLATATLEEAEYLAAEPELPPHLAEQQRLRRLLTTPRRVPLERSVIEGDLRRAELEVEQAELELMAVEARMDRTTFLAPFDGIVTQLFRQQGEWIETGEPLCEIVDFATLRLEVSVPADQFDPARLLGSEVGLTLEQPGGEATEIRGRIDHVVPLIEANGRFRVGASFPNRDAEGRWVTRPGARGTLTLRTAETAARQ